LYAPFDLPARTVLPIEEIAELDVDFFFCANTKRIEPRSYRRSAQIFHGLSFRNRALREATGGCDHYLVLGPYMRRRLARLGLFEQEDPRLVPIGFPKTDRLLNGTLERERVLRELGLSGERPVVLYAPTGAVGNSLETIGEEVIERLHATGAYDLLIKPHDHPKQPLAWDRRLAALEDRHLHVVRTPDAIPSLFVADLLISDASSLANECTLLDRPIVFLDVPELLVAAAAEDGRIDLETWGRKGGVVVASAAEAVAAVEEGLANPGRRSGIRLEMVRDLFYNPGCATEAALDWLRSELASLQSDSPSRIAASL
jgi:hypothetical protein